jgi:hypothetical protein
MLIKDRPTLIFTGSTMLLFHGARIEIDRLPPPPGKQNDHNRKYLGIFLPKYMESCHVTVIFVVPIMRTYDRHWKL